jgi:hypothetical protein
MGIGILLLGARKTGEFAPARRAPDEHTSALMRLGQWFSARSGEIGAVQDA